MWAHAADAFGKPGKASPETLAELRQRAQQALNASVRLRQQFLCLVEKLSQQS
jgi:hypothetical protein